MIKAEVVFDGEWIRYENGNSIQCELDEDFGDYSFFVYIDGVCDGAAYTQLHQAHSVAMEQPK